MSQRVQLVVQLLQWHKPQAWTSMLPALSFDTVLQLLLLLCVCVWGGGGGGRGGGGRDLCGSHHFYNCDCKVAHVIFCKNSFGSQFFLGFACWFMLRAGIFCSLVSCLPPLVSLSEDGAIIPLQSCTSCAIFKNKLWAINITYDASILWAYYATVGRIPPPPPPPPPPPQHHPSFLVLFSLFPQTIFNFLCLCPSVDCVHGVLPVEGQQGDEVSQRPAWVGV